MAARKLAEPAVSGDQPSRRAANLKSWKKGQSGNPSGRSKFEVAAERDRRALAEAHGQEALPDGRTRVRAVLDAVCTEALGGSSPHATLYLAYAVGKPTDNVRLDGDISLSIRKRVFEPDADNNG